MEDKLILQLVQHEFEGSELKQLWKPPLGDISPIAVNMVVAYTGLCSPWVTSIGCTMFPQQVVEAHLVTATLFYTLGPLITEGDDFLMPPD